MNVQGYSERILISFNPVAAAVVSVLSIWVLKGSKNNPRTLKLIIFRTSKVNTSEKFMIRAKDIVEYAESLCGHILNTDEGVQYGSLERPIKKVLICWMATASALEETGKTGSDLVIAHESLYYPYNAIIRKDNPLGWEKWQTNVQRTSLLMKYNLTFMRIHGTLDEICIFDDFAKKLRLGEADRS